MAQKVQVILVDDLDGGVAEETVSFALDGVSYEIDLSSAHAQEFRGALDGWVGKARRVSGRASSGGRAQGRRRSAGSGSSATAIREWARANGHQVNERGRISAEIKAAYEAAH